MIDKNHLRNTMLALTEAELEQAHKTGVVAQIRQGEIVNVLY